MLANRSDDQYLKHVWTDIPGAEHDSHVFALNSANVRARKTWSDIHNMHQHAMRDPTKTEAGRLIKSAKFAKAVLETQRAEFVEARAAAEVELRSLKAKLQRATNPPSDPGEAAVFADIRAYLRKMDHGELVALVDAAIQPGGDMRIAHAAISGPVLTGLLQPELHEKYTAHFQVHMLPNEFAKAGRLAEALEHATAGQAVLEDHAKQLIDFRGAELAERSSDYSAVIM